MLLSCDILKIINYPLGKPLFQYFSIRFLLSLGQKSVFLTFKNTFKYYKLMLLY